MQKRMRSSSRHTNAQNHYLSSEGEIVGRHRQIWLEFLRKRWTISEQSVSRYVLHIFLKKNRQVRYNRNYKEKEKPEELFNTHAQQTANCRVRRMAEIILSILFLHTFGYYVRDLRKIVACRISLAFNPNFRLFDDLTHSSSF